MGSRCRIPALRFSRPWRKGRDSDGHVSGSAEKPKPVIVRPACRSQKPRLIESARSAATRESTTSRNRDMVYGSRLDFALAMAAQDRGARRRSRAHPVGTSIRKSALAESRSSGRCRQTGDLIGGVSADTFLGRNLMSQRQSVVGILVAGALVVAGLFAPRSA